MVIYKDIYRRHPSDSIPLLFQWSHYSTHSPQLLGSTNRKVRPSRSCVFGVVGQHYNLNVEPPWKVEKFNFWAPCDTPSVQFTIMWVNFLLLCPRVTLHGSKEVQMYWPRTSRPDSKPGAREVTRCRKGLISLLQHEIEPPTFMYLISPRPTLRPSKENLTKSSYLICDLNLNR